MTLLKTKLALALLLFLTIWALCDAARGRPRSQRKHRQSVGCDGVLGSSLVVDKCGVCGGSNTECQIFSGLIDQSFGSIGYHTLLTIPIGAMYINVTETVRSRNYLALQTSSGEIVFNGNWRIDYPGNYSAAGVNVMYLRPVRGQSNKGEEIHIRGPTSVELVIKIIYQERNPGIAYGYVIPNPAREKTDEAPTIPSEDDQQQASQISRDDQVQARPTPPHTTTRRLTTTQMTTAPATTAAPQTTRPTTTMPTQPPPPPPPSTANPPLHEEKGQGSKDTMSISTGVMPGHGMGKKEEPQGYAGVDTSSRPDPPLDRQSLGSGTEDSRHFYSPTGSSFAGGSALSGSMSGNIPGGTGNQDGRPPLAAQESVIEREGAADKSDGSRPTGQVTPSNIPGQGNGNQRQTQTQIVRGENQGHQPGQPQFFGYYPNGYSPPERGTPDRDAVLPVSQNVPQAPQSSQNQTGVAEVNSRPSNSNSNQPSGRATSFTSRSGSSGQMGTTVQSGLFAGSYNRGVPGSSRQYYNPYQSGAGQSRHPSGSLPHQGGSDLPRPGTNQGVNPVNPNVQQPRPGFSQPQSGLGDSIPTGDIVYNPNYRPPPNHGMPINGGQSVPSSGRGSPIYGQGVPNQNQGGSSIPVQGGPTVPRQPIRPGTLNPYPYRPNPGSLPDKPSQPSSNLPHSSGQTGISYPYPGRPVQPSGPGFGQQDPQTNFSPFSGGVQRPIVPIAGEDTETLPSEDYSSSIPEEDQGNQANLGRNPFAPDPPVGQNAQYIWMETGLTECSVSCAGGIRETIVQCVQENSFFISEDSMCNVQYKPTPRRKTCNNDRCPPEWNAGQWGDCSRTCGEGRQMRSVTCRQTVTQSITLPVSIDQCAGLTRPPSTQSCTQRACSSWRAGSWGSCSAQCGDGERRREVTCVDEARSGIDESECSHLPKPDETQTCDAGVCRMAWFMDEWSEECSSECGSGQLSRGVVCSTEGTTVGAVPGSQCTDREKPSAVRTCSNAPCGARWFASEWGRCSVECGPGTQTREVLCLSSNPSPRIVSHRSCSGAPPPTSQPCEEAQCTPHWFTTEWSECSRSCGGGHRTRRVKCLDGRMQYSSACEGNSRHSSRETCNIQQCMVMQPGDPTCVDRFTYCDKIHQARLCSYSYYRQRCCYSCRYQ